MGHYREYPIPQISNIKLSVHFYLSQLTRNLYSAIFVVFDGRATMMYQGPISCGSEKSWNSCTPCPDPLSKGALKISSF